MKKISISVTLLLLNFQTAFGYPIEDYAEVSSGYIGTCVGINYLKESQCPRISSVDSRECINQTVALVHPKYRNIFKAELDKQIPIINSDIPPYIAKGFSKTEKIFNNKDSACISYGSSLLTMKNEKLNELKRISDSWIKNEK